MKPAFYDSLDKIPEVDRNDYKLITETGSPNFNKYVLDLDPQHPVALKNVELLGEKATREATQAQVVAAAVQQKDSEIQNLNVQLQAAKAQSGLPAGQVAVPAEKLQILTQYESLGKFEDVKAKVEEHGSFKEQTAAQQRKDLLTEAAKAHGFDPDAFILLAEPEKLADKIEMREVSDPKKPAEKVKHYFVKDKDAAGADTTTVLGDYVKTHDKFKPFLASLQPPTKGHSRRVPDNGVGDPPQEKAGGQAYISNVYKRPDAKKEATA